MATKSILVDVNFNGNELQKAVIQNLAAAPATPKAGQLYFNTVDNKLYLYNGTTWVDATSQGKIYTFSAPLSADVNDNVTVDTASNSAAGVIKIATDQEAETGTSETLAVNPKQLATKITSNAAVTAATKCKITYDAKGLVTAGADLVSSDIPDLSATYVLQSAVAVANGIASLDSNGKVPTSQLPSFVDDVIDAYIVSGASPLSAGWLSKTSGGSALTPETDKIYVIVESGSIYENKTYRWSGSTYVEISASPAQATESAAGIAAIATQAEVTTGTNDTKIITPLKLATHISGMAKKITATNTALTASAGVCTWTISNTLGTADVIVSIYEVSTGDMVFAAVNTSNSSITVKFNSSSNIAANTYKAVIIG